MYPRLNNCPKDNLSRKNCAYIIFTHREPNNRLDNVKLTFDVNMISMKL